MVEAQHALQEAKGRREQIEQDNDRMREEITAWYILHVHLYLYMHVHVRMNWVDELISSNTTTPSGACFVRRSVLPFYHCTFIFLCAIHRLWPCSMLWKLFPSNLRSGCSQVHH